MKDKEYGMKTKLCVVAMVAVIASAGFGSSYAYLYGGPFIRNVYRTPNVKIIDFTISDNEFEEGVVDPKDVGDVTAYICCGKTIKSFITNAYPSYKVYISFTIQNKDSKRVHIDEVSIEEYDNTAFEIAISTIACTWICPGETLDGLLTVHILQEAEQNSQYSFNVKIRTSHNPLMRPRPAWFWKQQFQIALGIMRGSLIVTTEELEQYLDQVSIESEVFHFSGSQKEKFEQALDILKRACSPAVKSRLEGKLFALWLNYVAGWMECLTIEGMIAYEVILGSEHALLNNMKSEYRYWRDLCHKFNYHPCA